MLIIFLILNLILLMFILFDPPQIVSVVYISPLPPTHNIFLSDSLDCLRSVLKSKDYRERIGLFRRHSVYINICFWERSAKVVDAECKWFFLHLLMNLKEAGNDEGRQQKRKIVLPSHLITRTACGKTLLPSRPVIMMQVSF